MDRQTLEDCLVGTPFPELLQAVKHGEPQDILPLLDAELARNTERTRRLNEYRNSISSRIHAIPAELLSRVFFIYATDAHALYSLRWTKLLLVCRRWYQIGINTAKLWSYISVHAHTSGISYGRPMRNHILRESPFEREVRRVELQRSRAGRVALSVQLTFETHTTTTNAKEPSPRMFWHPESLSFLSLYGGGSHIRATLEAMAEHQHTALKTLTVTEPVGRRLIFQHNQGLNAGADAEVLVNEAERTGSITSLDDVLKCSPRLQQLFAQEVLFSWPLIGGLRELRAKYDGQAPSQHRVEDLLAALARCPLLEVLQLHLPTNCILDGAAATSVSLSQLASVSLVAKSDVCCAILHSLKDLPDHAQVTASVLDPPEASVIDAMASYIGKHTHSTNSPVIRGISINRKRAAPSVDEIGITGLLGVDRLRLTALSNSYLFPQESEPHPPSIHVGLWTRTTAAGQDAVQTLLTDIARSWSFSSVAYLDLRSCTYTAPPDFWNGILDALPEAHTILMSAGLEFAEAVLQLLLVALREHRKRVVANIILDVSDSRDYTSLWLTPTGPPVRRARMFIMRVLAYCAEAAHAGCALDTVEIANDSWQESRVLDTAEVDLDWSELYRDLKEGFVYEGFLHNSESGPEGVIRDSFAKSA